MKAMIFAAGIGSRLAPLTNKTPKALIEVGGKAAIGHVLDHITGVGIKDIVINLHHFPDKIKQYVDKNYHQKACISYSYEDKELLETGGGLLKAKKIFADTDAILLHNADILSNIDLEAFIKHHQNRKADVSLAVRDRNSSRKLHFNEENRLVGWENTKNKEIIGRKGISRFAFSGIHLIQTRILKEFTKTGAFSIISQYLDIMHKIDIQAFLDNDSYWFDIGSKEKLEKARAFFNSSLQ